MVNGGGWQPANGGRGGNNHRNYGRYGVDRRGAVQRKVWEESRKQGRKGFVDKIRDSNISFYFTNFPEDASKSELWKVFSLAGDVADVFIPAKLDKLGRRFGFVRYKNERDLPRLERRLQRTWLGTYKLQINRSHSPIVDTEANRNVAADRVNSEVPHVVVAVPAVPEVANPIRWGEWPRVGAWKKIPPDGSNKDFNMEYDVNEDRVKMLNACYIGILVKSSSATAMEFQHSLILEGYHAIKVTPMGGDSVLLSCTVDGLIIEAINSNRRWWSTWLRGFSVWDPSLISSKRRVWLRCLGVPLHAWEENFFKSLGMKFGECEEVDEDTRVGSRYDVGRVRILTSYAEPIDLTVNLFIAGERFPISVVEERFGNIDGGMSLPQQQSAKIYSSGSDDLSSGVGESVVGFDGGLEGFEEENEWCNSAGRSLL